MKRQSALLLTVLALAGCDSPPSSQLLPEVSGTNCTMEVINGIEDKAAREQFAGECSRHSGAIRHTEKPKNWLELNSKQG